MAAYPHIHFQKPSPMEPNHQQPPVDTPRPSFLTRLLTRWAEWKTQRDEARQVRIKAEQEKIAAEQKALNGRVEAEIAKWKAIRSEEKRKLVLARAEAKRVEEVAWSRSLDSKVSPVLAVAGFSIGGLLTLLNGLSSKDGNILTGKPWVTFFLICALISLFYTAVKSVRVISPTLRLSKPFQRVFGRIPIFRDRHKPQATGWRGHLFFGHADKYDEVDEFMRSAIPHFADEKQVLRDTLEQGYINARLNTEKSNDITYAVRGVLVAIFFVALAGGVLTHHLWEAWLTVQFAPAE